MAMTAPLWREMETALIARGIAPQFDWTDYAALLRVVEKNMRDATGQGSAYLRIEALRADQGLHH
jgi:hypothetical protein